MATIPPAPVAPPDAGAGAAAAPPAAEEAAPEVLVTISKSPDGGFIVQAGDEEEAGADGAAAPEPVTCKTVGEALKAAMDILQGSAGGDSEQDEDASFQAGFKGDKEPTPAAQKY